MSDSNLATLAQVAETSWNILPASPILTQKRFTKSTLNYLKETVVSGEIRSDRQIPGILQVGITALGGYEYELSARDFDLMLTNAMFCVPLVINLPAIAVTIVNGTRTVTAASGTFSALLPQQRIRISGTGGVSDGVWTVFSVAGNGASFTTTETTIASYSGTATFTATVYRNGVTRNSMSIEMSPAPGFFIQFGGMMVNTMKWTLEAKKIVTGSVEFLGYGATASTSTESTGGAYLPASTNPIMTAAANVGRLWNNNVPFTTGIKMLTLEIQNMLRPQPVVGQLGLFGVGLGQFKVSGQVQMYFKDLNVFNEFVAHTPSSLSAVMTDGNGNGLSFTLPSVQFDTGKTDIPGVNTDIMADFTYTAQLDPVSGITMQISEV